MIIGIYVQLQSLDRKGIQYFFCTLFNIMSKSFYQMALFLRLSSFKLGILFDYK